MKSWFSTPSSFSAWTKFLLEESNRSSYTKVTQQGSLIPDCPAMRRSSSYIPDVPVEGCRTWDTLKLFLWAKLSRPTTVPCGPSALHCNWYLSVCCFFLILLCFFWHVIPSYFICPVAFLHCWMLLLLLSFTIIAFQFLPIWHLPFVPVGEKEQQGNNATSESFLWSGQKFVDSLDEDQDSNRR